MDGCQRGRLTWYRALQVSEFDCLLLEHVFGARPADAVKVRTWVLETLASDPGLQQTELLFLGLFGRSCRVLEERDATVCTILFVLPSHPAAVSVNEDYDRTNFTCILLVKSTGITKAVRSDNEDEPPAFFWRGIGNGSEHLSADPLF